MQCTKIISQLDRFLEKSLSNEDMARTERHLLSCLRCNNELVDIRELKKSFSADQMVSIPDNLSFEICENINNRVKFRDFNQKYGVFSWFIGESRWTRIMYASVVLIAMFSGFFMSSKIWFSETQVRVGKDAEIVESIYNLEPFYGNSDGSLYSLYIDVAMSSKLGDKP